MKRFLMFVMLLVGFVSFSGCGNNEVLNNENAEGNNIVEKNIIDNDEAFNETKTLAFFNKYLSSKEYTMKIKTEYEGVESTILSAYYGDDFYTESEYDGVKSAVIMKDGVQYILDHASKTCIKTAMVNQNSTNDMFAEEVENYNIATNTGVTQYNGKKYDYEEFDLDGSKVQYLFDGDALKIIKTDIGGIDSIMEIVSINKGVDKKLFEVPTGYNIIEY